MEFPPWTCREMGRNVHEVAFDFKNESDMAYILLRSDAHHDNPDSLNDLEEKHLKLAKERNAPIIDNGDAFCAMQGKWDPRADKSALKPEHQVDDYLDALVSTYADFLAPYASQLAVLGTGNHETSVLSRRETNLTERLAERLRVMAGFKGFTGSYTSWVFIKAKCGKANSRNTIKLWRTHGQGGGGPVTRGVIQSNRRAVYVPDANIVVSGHIHEEWVVPIQRIRVSQRGEVFQDEQTHVQVPSYKDSYKDGYSYGEWSIERGMAPKPVGAVWLKLTIKGKKLAYEIERAK
jgi:hypothetical protein